VTVAITFLGLGAFALFATFEPMADNVAWKIGYGIAALGCLVGFVLVVRANRPGSGGA
jgi:dipeptide/tripeptide permease